MGALRLIVPILVDAGGVSIPVYALLDTGANRSAILTSLVYRIGGKINEKFCKISTFGQNVSSNCEFTDFSVQPLDESFSFLVKGAIVGDILTTERDIPLTNKDIEGHSYLKDVRLQELEDKTVGVILDVNFVRYWTGSEVRKGLEDQPIGILTKFGWAVHGPPLEKKDEMRSKIEELALNAQELLVLKEILGPVEQQESVIEMGAYDAQELTLLQEINSMFRHDFILGRNDYFPHEKIHPSQEDEFSERQLRDSINFEQEDVRYVVGLPYVFGREKAAEILNSVDSYANAEKRLWSLKKRFLKDEVLKAGVFSQIATSLKEGHIKIVEKSEPLEGQAVYYMPILVVLHPDKPGKFRVCQDAASLVKGVCLNNQVLSGPDYMNSLVGIMFRFREGKVCYSADIKDFFYRVGLDPRDAGCFRFLFFEDEKMEKIIQLEGDSHLFGIASSPVVAGFTLRYHAEVNREGLDGKVLRTVQKQFYVDDLIDSSDDIPESREMRQKLTALLKKGGFDLCKWESNHVQMLFDNDQDYLSSLLHQEGENAAEVWSQDVGEAFVNDGVIPNDDHVISTVQEIAKNEDGMGKLENIGELNDLLADDFSQMMGKQPSLNQKILGVGFSFEEDYFFIRIKPKHERVVETRRQTLSLVASVYDPLGFVSPFVFLGRDVLQKSIMEGLTWDDKLLEELQQKINEWSTSMKELRKIKIPRWTSRLGFENAETRLVIFCDASFEGYGVVVYMRKSLTNGDEAFVSIMFSKSHVVPINMQRNMLENQEDHGDSIPRLELTAARLAATTRDMIVNESREKFDKIHHITDSMTVLRWIHDYEKRFKTFENFRLKKIRLLTNPLEWYHIDGKLNPADVCSHGIKATEIEKFQDFISGPAFLKDQVENWPVFRPELKEIPNAIQDSLGEVSTFSPVELIQLNAVKIQVSEDFESVESWIIALTKRKSIWTMKVRILANFKNHLLNWLRFLRLKKNGESEKFVKEELSLAKLHDAELNLVKAIQFSHFEKEIKKLLWLGVNSPNAHKELRTKTSRLNSLSPFLDGDNVLRAGGRLGKALFIMYDTKYPKILPKNCSQVKSLIRHCHLMNAHSSRLQTYHLLRHHYLLLGGRPEVNAVISSCVTCQKLEKLPIPQRQAELPNQRLDLQIPWQAIAVDVFGPYHVKFGGRGTTKRWVLLATDMVTRSVCLTALTDMSSDSFKLALVRIHSQYPVMREIFCDNGTNFVGGARELSEAFESWKQSQTTETVEKMGIDFHFGAPDCPSAGGVWERLVRSCKKHLKVLLRNEAITDTVFSTVLCEVSAIMNRRPITYATNDIDDPQALSPINFLFPYTALSSSCSTLPPTPLSGDNARKTWRLLRQIVEEYWQRFSDEYITTLRKRTKWMNSEKVPYIGQIVIMADKQLPRETWPLAIVESIESEDKKHPRRVIVKTASGAKFHRHVTSIVPLELDGEDVI